MSTAAGSAGTALDHSERAWWLRALLVLQAPRAVFAALRDDSDDAEDARQEPVTALVLLAGIAGVLAGPTTRTLLDDFELDVVDAVIITFLAGVIYAAVGYWAAGKALQLASRWLGSRGSYRRSRHVLGFACAPLALSLVVVWPFRFALYGSDVFRGAGADAGTPEDVFTGVVLVFAVWAVALLAIGVRTVHGWSWARSAAACGIAAALAGIAIGGLAAAFAVVPSY
jgi:hypothetical protein